MSRDIKLIHRHSSGLASASCYSINPALPQIMWVDLNSAFATTEQQAHPHLRHKPVGITNRISPRCCIITASYEAKARGVRTGMRRDDALRLCPDLVLLESDPPKYNHVYHRLFDIMNSYSADCGMKSIDEGYINLVGTAYDSYDKLVQLGYDIKSRVKSEIGNYMTINVGLGTNRFLAKLAAGLHKPDGMDIITTNNILSIYDGLLLEDLTGIAKHNGLRLRQGGITTPLQFLNASESYLRHQIFRSINGSYWYRRLRGYEVDNYKTNLSTIGRQWVVDAHGDDWDYLESCLHCLAESVGLKLRWRQVQARGVCVWLRFQSGDYYRQKLLADQPFDADSRIWQIAQQLFNSRPYHKIQTMGIYLYNFTQPNHNQLTFLDDVNKTASLTKAIDLINYRYGNSTIHSAHSSAGLAKIKQKVPFGGTDYLDLLID